VNPPPGSSDPDDDGDEPTFPDGPSLGELFHDLDPTELEEIRRAVAGLGASGAAEGRPFLASLGPFRDLEEIGRGGMGIVYRAYDPSTGRLVAVKVPSVGLTSKGARKRFRREIDALRSLDHPAVVRWLGVGEDGDRSYLVIEYCDGPTLAEWLRARKDAVPPREAARIVAVLADAVAHSHARDLLHRDIKPSNVLLPGAKPDSAPEALSPRLSDFGLAKLLTRSDGEVPPEVGGTITEGLLGSPPYMAPELAGVGLGTAGATTDVYGLGAILYETLTGRPPFRGQGLSETLRMIVQDEPVPVRVLSPGVPKPLETIALKCLEKDPGDRFGTAAELRDDLRRFLDGRPIQARPPRPAVRLRRWRRRHPRVAFAATATLAVLALVFAASAAWNVSLRRLNEDLLRAGAREVRLNQELIRERDRANRDARASRLHDYASRLQLARAAFDDGQLGRAQQTLLALAPPNSPDDPREFAWRYLWASTRREARLLGGLRGGLWFSVLSRDERMLASCDDSGEVEVYDLEADRVVWSRHLPHDETVAALTFSPDGSKLAAVIVPREVQEVGPSRIEVLDARDGRTRTRTATRRCGRAAILHFLDEGRRIASLHHPEPLRKVPTEADSVVWGCREGDVEAPDSAVVIPWMATSHSGDRHVSVGPDGRPGLYDVASHSWARAFPEAPTSDLRLARFSDDDGRLLIATSHEAAVYDVASGGRLCALPAFDSPPVDATFQPGGVALIVRLDSREVRLVDPSRGLDVRIFEPTAAPGVSTRHQLFTPDGEAFLIHRSVYMGVDRVELRSSDDGRLLAESPVRVKGNDGHWLVRRAGPELIYGLGRLGWCWNWTKTRGREAEAESSQAHSDEAWKVVYSPDGLIRATTSNSDVESTTIKLWDARSGRRLRGWSGDDATITDLAFSPDGRWIATSSLAAAGRARIWDVATGRQIGVVEMTDGERTRSVAIDGEGRVLFVGGDRGTVLAWDVRLKRARWRDRPPEGPSRPRENPRVHRLIYSPRGGRLAVADDWGRLRIRDSETGAILAEYRTPTAMLAIAYRPDGHLLAATDQEGSVHLIDAETGRETRRIFGDEAELRAVAFSPDGRTLATGGLGRTVRLWDAETGDELLALDGHQAQVNDLTFSPDGATLASADHAGVVRFWRTRPDAPR